MILIYTKLYCPQCKTTTGVLDALGTAVGICNGPADKKHLKPVRLENVGTERKITRQKKEQIPEPAPVVRRGTIKRKGWNRHV